MCPAWLLVVAVVGVARGAASQCWEHPSCQDLSTESNMLECLQLCHSDLTEESPVFPGEAHLAPVLSSSSSSSSDPSAADPPSLLLAPASSSSLLLDSSPSDPQAVQVPVRRSYSMEHFRWGKPVGRKRRPIKTPSSSSSSSDPADPPSPLLPADSSSLLLASSPSDPQGSQAVRSPARRSYHMGHFRWGKPSKREPVKVYKLAGGDGAALEEPAESSDELGFLPSEMRRELLANEVLQGEEAFLRQDGGAEPNAAGPMLIPAEKKRDGNYKMSHFRWSGPPATKRYGGFMKSWDQGAQKPLLTLFKNVIHQDADTEQE